MKNPQTIPFPVQAVERIFTPPCSEIEDRLVRLRVIDSDGEVDGVGIGALCITLGATLYDNLYETGADIESFYENLATLYYDEEIIGAYLYLCVQYGMLGESVPAELMLLPMHYEALSAFIEALIFTFEEYLIADGIIGGVDEFPAEEEHEKPGANKVVHLVVTFADATHGLREI